MSDENSIPRLEQVKRQLLNKEEEYKKAVQLHKDYNTLKGIRSEIKDIKKLLQSLEGNSNKSHGQVL